MTDPSRFGGIRPTLVFGAVPFGDGVRARAHSKHLTDYRKVVTQSYGLGGGRQQVIRRGVQAGTPRAYRAPDLENVLYIASRPYHA